MTANSCPLCGVNMAMVAGNTRGWPAPNRAASSGRNSHIRLRRSKTKRSLVIPVAEPLKQFLQNEAKRSLLLLTDRRGRPWAASPFKHAWKRIMVKAGIVWADLRRLAGDLRVTGRRPGRYRARDRLYHGHGLGDIRRISDTITFTEIPHWASLPSENSRAKIELPVGRNKGGCARQTGRQTARSGPPLLSQKPR
jgi:hypothetical protein